MNLMPSFFKVVLINADGVDPQDSIFVLLAQMLQCLKQALCDVQTSAVDLNRVWLVIAAPCVRQCLVLDGVLGIVDSCMEQVAFDLALFALNKPDKAKRRLRNIQGFVHVGVHGVRSWQRQRPRLPVRNTSGGLIHSDWLGARCSFLTSVRSLAAGVLTACVRRLLHDENSGR